MGKVEFTPLQKLVINEFRKTSSLVSRFYLTGGTALSVFYLKHRLSEDLDFFSEEKFRAAEILKAVDGWARALDCQVEVKQIEETLTVDLVFDEGAVKVDFHHYPYQRLKAGQSYDGLTVDSLLDIAVNKLVLLNQRTDIKDFVDLYFLRDKFTLWDLLEGVKKKFRFELEPVLVSADLLKVEEFDFLPQMRLPLTIDELRAHFHQLAVNLTGRVCEP